MWSLILYFLFGVGSPSNGNHSDNHNGSSSVQSVSKPPSTPGDGGDKGNTRPPKL